MSKLNSTPFVGPMVNILVNFGDRLGVRVFFDDAYKAMLMAFRSPRKQQVQYLIDFDQWVKDGANLLDAVREMKTAALRLGKKRSFPYRASVSIEKALVNGLTVSEGMKGIFSQDLVSLFRVGEETHSITLLFENFIKQEDERSAVFKGGVKRLVYPSILLLLTFSILVLLDYIGIPKAKEMGINLELLSGIPGTTINLARGVTTYLLPVVYLLFVLYVFYKITKNHYVSQWGFLPSRDAFDKIFPYSIHKEFVAMGIVQRIGLLSSVGMPLGAAVKTLMKSATPYEQKYYQMISIKTGSSTGSVADYLNVGLLNAEIFQRLSGVARQEGEHTKIKAILAASRDSGTVAKKRLDTMLYGVLVVLWLLFIVFGGVTGLGLSLAPLQFKNIITIN